MTDLEENMIVEIETDPKPPPPNVPRIIVVHEDPIENTFYNVVYWSNEDEPNSIHVMKNTEAHSKTIPWRVADTFMVFTVEAIGNGRLGAFAHTPSGLPVWKFETVDTTYNTVSLVQNVGGGGLVISVTKLQNLLSDVATSRMYVHVPLGQPKYTPHDVIVIDDVYGLVSCVDIGSGISLWVVLQLYDGTSMVSMYDLRKNHPEEAEITFVPADFQRVKITKVCGILAINEHEALLVVRMDNSDVAWTRIKWDDSTGMVSIGDIKTFGHYENICSNAGILMVTSHRYEDGFIPGEHQVTVFSRYNDELNTGTSKISINTIMNGGPAIKCPKQGGHAGRMYEVSSILGMYKTSDNKNSMMITLQASWGNVYVVFYDGEDHHIMMTLPTVECGRIVHATYCMGTQDTSFFSILDARDKKNETLFHKTMYPTGLTRANGTGYATSKMYRRVIGELRQSAEDHLEQLKRLRGVNQMMIKTVKEDRKTIDALKSDAKASELIIHDMAMANAKDYEDLMKKYTDLEVKYKDAQGQLKQVKTTIATDLDDMRAALSTSQAKCKDLCIMNNTLMKETRTLRHEINASRKSMDKKVADIMAQKRELEERLRNSPPPSPPTALTTITSSLQTTDHHEVAKLKDTIKTLRRLVKKQTNTTKEVDEKMDRDYKQAQLDIEQLQSSLARFKADRATHDMIEQKLYGEITRLTCINQMHSAMVAQVCCGYMADGMSIEDAVACLHDNSKLRRDITELKSELAGARALIHSLENQQHQ